MTREASYYLCQGQPDPPSLDLLTSVFAQVNRLTQLDARLALQQGFGVLAERLLREEADGLCRRLEQAYYPAAVVAEEELALPRATPLSRAGVGDDAFSIYDFYGRAHPIDWKDLLVLHAGSYPRGQIATTRRAGFAVVCGHVYSWDAVREYVETDEIVLELVFASPPRRFSIRPTPFNYGDLGPRRVHDSSANFAILLGDL